MDYNNRQMVSNPPRHGKQADIFDDTRRAIKTHGAKRVRLLVTPNTEVPSDLRGVAEVRADLRYCAVQLRYPTAGQSDD